MSYMSYITRLKTSPMNLAFNRGYCIADLIYKYSSWKDPDDYDYVLYRFIAHQRHLLKTYTWKN